MQIGFIRKEQMVIKENNINQTTNWFECYFRIAGIRPFSAKMTPNKNKTDSKHPDYIIYLRGNVNKGDTFRDIPIGSLWLGEKFIDGQIKKFMTGSIEVAFNKVSIAVWKAEPKYENEEIKYLYDIKTMEDKRNQEQNTYENNDTFKYSGEIQDEPF